MEFMIDMVEKKADMSWIAEAIKQAYDKKEISWDEFKRLKELYSNKYNSLWA